jgi:hypothetical protein
MKVNIWIRKEEAISGNITKYYNVAPQSSDWPNYVEVSITQDEFAKLEDRDSNNSRDLTYPEFVDKHYKKESKDDWLVAQYNRNREQKDWVKSKKEIPYIYEKNPDTGTVYRRHSGDKHENRERVSMGVAERDYSGEKGLSQLQEEMMEKTGAEFMTWFHKLTKNEQTKLASFYND